MHLAKHKIMTRAFSSTVFIFRHAITNLNFDAFLPIELFFVVFSIFENLKNFKHEKYFSESFFLYCCSFLFVSSLIVISGVPFLSSLVGLSSLAFHSGVPSLSSLVGLSLFPSLLFVVSPKKSNFNQTNLSLPESN